MIQLNIMKSRQKLGMAEFRKLNYVVETLEKMSRKKMLKLLKILSSYSKFFIEIHFQIDLLIF
jgi:hypothetical protein